ncbi:cadherin-like beta sandwich domain-containing protein, partial [Synergistaceae bacterium OttesenSCG-928-D05]|nr:cadherin-like beta sandwich domain-containing protein [Synergistaceae bacterium OttesenSCG-928-D05]
MVKLADNRVIVVFDLELELATNVADRGAGDGYTFPMAKLARKFSFSDNTLRIVNIALHAHTFSLDDALRTFSVFEIVTDVALGPTATLSYNPAFEEDDSFVLAVPSTQSLLAGFTNISPVAPAATLTEIELGDALRGLSTRKILDAASPPQINDEAFACFEVVLSDDIPETTITFIPSDNSVLWTTDFGAPRNGSGESTNAINLNPGVNKATITLGTGENPISYTAFIIRDVDTAPALRSLKVTPISDQAGQPQSIPLTQGQLAYYINFQSNATGVQVAPEADAGVSVFVNDVPLQGGVSGTIALSIGSANKINIRLVDAENHETTYSLYVTRGNEAILTGLKLTKVDEGDRGGGVTPYIEVPIRHAGSDENGYIQDGERDASGWQQYVADANRSGSFAGVEFYLEPTFNAGTRVFVSNVKKTKLDPADEVVADADGVFRSKPFVLNYRGEELTLYLTMFRQRPGGTDWIMSDSSVAVSIVTEPVQSKLTQIIVRDGATYEQLLALSGDELMVSTQNSITTSKFAKSIVVEVARTSTDLVFTPDFSFTPEDSGALRLRSDVKFSAYGEEKELTIKTIDSHTQDEKIYKLNVTQGHPPYVILGLSSDEVFKYDPSKIRLDVNGAPFEGLYDLETGEAIRTVKVPHLPNRTDADGNTVLTVDWAMSPPTGDLNVEFALTEFSKSGYWRIQNITKNANGRGGTLELVLLRGDGGEFRQRRTYTDMTSQTLHTVGLVARLYKSGKLLALNYSEFAKVVDNLFKDIVIDVIENTKPIIKSEKDRYPEDKRLPIIDFKLWGVSYAEDSDNKRIGLQVGRTYKIPLVYSVVTTYGDYREYVRKHPDMGERYPYVFAAGESTPIPVLLEDLRTRNDPGYSPNMMDNRPLDFSHDKITYSMSNEDSNRWYVK